MNDGKLMHLQLYMKLNIWSKNTTTNILYCLSGYNGSHGSNTYIYCHETKDALAPLIQKDLKTILSHNET